MLKFKETTQNYPLFTNLSLLTSVFRFIPHFSHHRKSRFFRAFFHRKVTQVYPSGARTSRFLDINSAAGFHENFAQNFRVFC